MAAPRRRSGGPAALALALSTVLTACADYKPFRPPDNSAIPEGPGLFSGEDGEWVLFRVEKEAAGEEAGEEAGADAQ